MHLARRSLSPGEPVKRAPDAGEERRALRAAGGIVTPRDATGERQRQRVGEDDVGGELGAERCATIAAGEPRLPRGARVGEYRAVQRAGEERPRPDAAFDPSSGNR